MDHAVPPTQGPRSKTKEVMEYTVKAKDRRTSGDTASVIHVSLTNHVACACDGDAERGAQDKGWGECAGMKFCGLDSFLL